MEKSDVTKYFDLIEAMGEQALVQEWLCWSSNQELKEFIEHCEEYWEIDLD